MRHGSAWSNRTSNLLMLGFSMASIPEAILSDARKRAHLPEA
jgi:hypothetical protein